MKRIFGLMMILIIVSLAGCQGKKPEYRGKWKSTWEIENFDPVLKRNIARKYSCFLKIENKKGEYEVVFMEGIFPDVQKAELENEILKGKRGSKSFSVTQIENENAVMLAMGKVRRKYRKVE